MFVEPITRIDTRKRKCTAKDHVSQSRIESNQLESLISVNHSGCWNVTYNNTYYFTFKRDVIMQKFKILLFYHGHNDYFINEQIDRMIIRIIDFYPDRI